MKFKNALEPNTTKTSPTSMRAMNVATFIINPQKLNLWGQPLPLSRWSASRTPLSPDRALDLTTLPQTWQTPAREGSRRHGILGTGIHSHPPFSTGGPVAVVFTPVHSPCLA